MSNREQQPADGQRTCVRCGKPFTPLMRSAKYCTAICRQRAGWERQAEREREQRR
jgi:hypothetical protein